MPNPPTNATVGNVASPAAGAPSSGVNAMDSASERTTASASTGANKGSSSGGNPSSTGGTEPTAQAVLDYLKKMGMGSAHLELKTLLNKQKADDKSSDKTSSSESGKSTEALKQQLEHDDAVARNQRAVLTKSTGGGFGYDRDAAAPVVQWGVPDNTAMMRQLAAKKRSAAGEQAPETTKAEALAEAMGVEEARSYLDAFTALQIWVLSLPDDEDVLGNQPPVQPKTHNPIAAAQKFIRQHRRELENEASRSKSEDGKDAADTKDEDTSPKEISLSSLVKHMAGSASGRRKRSASSFHLPPSSKPELLAVTFALLVHTYCELLEVGMESTAHVLRDAFQPIYDPLYGKEFHDLFQCTTTEDMMKLNTHNSQHMEALANLKSIVVKIQHLQLKKDEFTQKLKMSKPDASTKSAANKRLQEFDQTINVLQKNYNELSQRASAAFGRMHDLPFLRRARAVRWQLTLSAATYGLLASFLNNHTAMQPSLLAMSTLLQTKCELHVEQRDPLPFTPACVLDDEWHSSRKRGRKSSLSDSDMINWAAPVTSNKRLYRSKKEMLPFPKFHLEEEYETADQARRDKRVVEFNRAMLVNGFRRLEALERKRDYQVMAPSYDLVLESAASAAASTTDPSSSTAAGAGATGNGGADTSSAPNAAVANALEPSILLSTLCANGMGTSSSKSDAMLAAASSNSKTGTAGSASGSGSGSTSVAAGGASTIWDESGIGLCCAEICPPDGRQVAVGCDDSAIRIWNLLDGMGPDGKMGEPVQVMLGHKNGFPVFDVSWNRDGRSLLSAGGDGSIRLWDTMAQGPFGKVGKPTQSSITSSSSSSKKSSSGSGGNTGTSTGGTITSTAAKQMLEESTTTLKKANANPDMTVPGLRPESNPYVSGAALAVYRGHAPSTPIWSVAFAPCGYYFASAGADSTARLWTTDRPSPVRLFAGHTGDSVNSVVFHPNCNYILTGCEDMTARLWDIQTGRCVRLLNGCASGISVVQVSPSGQYAAGADVSGIVHLWDLGTGKKVTEFRSKSSQANSNPRHSKSMVHSLSFSSCGTTVAAGGDDCCVRIWDVQKAATEFPKPVIDTPHKAFSTRRTMIMDLQYTKRNLLLSVGKYVTSV